MLQITPFFPIHLTKTDKLKSESKTNAQFGMHVKNIIMGNVILAGSVVL